MSLNFFHNWESNRVHREMKKMFSNPVTIFSGGNVLISVFFDDRTPRESFWRWTKDVVSTHYLAEVHASCFWIVLHECIEIRLLKTMTLFKKRHACLRTKVSSTNISCLVVILLLDASQSRVGGLFPSPFDLRCEFWRIQKLRERFEIWDRSTRAISVVKENLIQYVLSLFFVQKVRQDVFC